MSGYRDHEDFFDHVRVASEWHGGQASALYAFCSSGSIEPGASLEAERCVAQLEGGYDPGTGDDLGALLDETRALATFLDEHEPEDEDDE